MGCRGGAKDVQRERTRIQRLLMRTLWKLSCFEWLPAVKYANNAARSFLPRACHSANDASPCA